MTRSNSARIERYGIVCGSLGFTLAGLASPFAVLGAFGNGPDLLAYSLAAIGAGAFVALLGSACERVGRWMERRAWNADVNRIARRDTARFLADSSDDFVNREGR